jgi:hypothetical protein
VRIDSANARVERIDVVGPGRHRRAEPGNVWRKQGQVRAEVAEDIDLERQKTTIGVERHFGCRHIVATLRVADEMLAAIGEPAY